MNCCALRSLSDGIGFLEKRFLFCIFSSSRLERNGTRNAPLPGPISETSLHRNCLWHARNPFHLCTLSRYPMLQNGRGQTGFSPCLHDGQDGAIVRRSHPPHPGIHLRGLRHLSRPRRRRRGPSHPPCCWQTIDGNHRPTRQGPNRRQRCWRRLFLCRTPSQPRSGQSCRFLDRRLEGKRRPVCCRQGQEPANALPPYAS